MKKTISNTEKLVEEFLQKASNLKGEIGPIKVLKARVYQISKANVLIKAASGGNRNYFYYKLYGNNSWNEYL